LKGHPFNRAEKLFLNIIQPASAGATILAIAQFRLVLTNYFH